MNPHTGFSVFSIPEVRDGIRELSETAGHPETSIVLPDGMRVVPCIAPGSEELPEATQDAFSRHRVVLWRKRGVVAVGADPLRNPDRGD